MSLLKKSLSFLWRRKKLFLMFALFSAALFAFRFPWGLFLEKTAGYFFQTKPLSSFQPDFDEIRLKIFPPGVELRRLSFQYKRNRLSLPSFTISMALGQWLAFKKAWRIEAEGANSSLSLVFWKKRKAGEGEESPFEIFFAPGRAPFLALEDLNELFPDSKISGQLKASFNFEGSPDKIEEAEGELILEGGRLSLSKIELNTPLGPLSLPSLMWKQGELSAILKEGELAFKALKLGAPSDDLIIQAKGGASVFFSYGRLRLDSYDIQLQIEARANLKMSLLDLMFAGYKEEAGDLNRYRLRMTGRGQEVPHMEGLAEFEF